MRRDLLAFAEIGIYCYTTDGIVVRMDEATLRILELDDVYPDPDQVLGKNISELFEYELPPRSLRKQVLQTTELHGYEYTFRTLSGTRKCCLHDSRLVYDAETKQNQVLVITRDITHLKRAQNELAEANRVLVQANAELQSLDELKNNLLANVSHEIRSPLVSIRGYADLIKSGSSGPVTDRQKKQLEIIVANVERLTALVDDLLDSARLHRGVIRLKVERCDVNGLLEAALLRIEPKAAKKSITLRSEIHPGCQHIMADPRQLDQVIENLLGNAIKFTDKGGLVRAVTAPEGDGVTITISDNGVGIPSSALERVFERFYQVDSSSTRRFSGLGLGLSLCKTIVERHGGSIGLEYTLGEGTTVRVSLPPCPPASPFLPTST